MADELDGLLGRVEDPALRAELRAHIDRIRAKRTFGLVFESHLPERVRLPEHPVRSGAKVALRDDPKSATFQVVRVRKGAATVRPIRHADGALLSADEVEAAPDEEHPIDALVVIADFGEAIYPGFRRLGSVDRGGDKPAHVVIKGENHHVLEALQFTHAGKVDCIYIDPPYNTGARDWKYDNDYVDDSDAYRHSKWLAFMERRLLLAKQLLNPERSVLIVTIDEKEYLRLGLLLSQIFVGASMQMVSVAVNPAGVARAGAFSRSDEYYFFVALGTAAPAKTMLGPDWFSGRGRTFRGKIRWDLLRRSGTHSSRADRPNLHYPIYVDPSGPMVVAAGEPVEADGTASSRDGLVTVLPIRKNGADGVWQVGSAELMNRVHQGRIRVSGSAERGYVLYYLADGEYGKTLDGTYEVTGRADDGSVVTSEVVGDHRSIIPTTQWRVTAHDATQYGSRLLSSLIPAARFPFPKSLYAVEDAIRFFVKDDPTAVVLDFFGGSGTTAHAVARLNRLDGGRRQSIVVTNNEVSAAEADALRKAGHRPGDPEWEALGIFEHITRPRITAAITGLTPEGEPVKGDYKFTDEFPMAEGFEENVEFLELTYQDADDVELDLAFEAIAPLLWLRAGGQGSVIESRNDASGAPLPFASTDRYGVLFDTDRWRAFLEVLPESVSTVFVVTDSPATFAGIAADLPEQVEVVRLYENYLTTFRINEGLV